MGTENVLKEGLGLLQKLAQDAQDSVRLLVVEDLIAFGNLFTREQNQEYLLPIFQALAQDKSWRVRYMVASEYVEVKRSFFKSYSADLCFNLARLLKRSVMLLCKSILQHRFLDSSTMPKGKSELLQLGVLPVCKLMYLGKYRTTDSVPWQALPSLWTRRSLSRNCCLAWEIL